MYVPDRGEKYVAWLPVEDPGFPVGGGANPPGEDPNIQIFPKNCMKFRKFWSVRGGGATDPPLVTNVKVCSHVLKFSPIFPLSNFGPLVFCIRE